MMEMGYLLHAVLFVFIQYMFFASLLLESRASGYTHSGFAFLPLLHFLLCILFLFRSTDTSICLWSDECDGNLLMVNTAVG